MAAISSSAASASLPLSIKLPSVTSISSALVVVGADGATPLGAVRSSD